MPATSFQAILDKALADYREQIGVDLDKQPFADDLRGRNSPDDVLKLLEDKANAFKVYRDGNRKLIDWLSPVVKVVHTLSGVLGEAVSSISRIRYFFSLDLFAVRLPDTVKTSEGNLCWRGRSHHCEYLLTFSTYLSPKPYPRRPTERAQATMHLLNCLNVLETSSNAFGSILMSR